MIFLLVILRLRSDYPPLCHLIQSDIQPFVVLLCLSKSILNHSIRDLTFCYSQFVIFSSELKTELIYSALELDKQKIMTSCIVSCNEQNNRHQMYTFIL